MSVSSRKKITVLYLGLMIVMLVLILGTILAHRWVLADQLMFVPSVLTVLVLGFAVSQREKPLSRRQRLLTLGIGLLVVADFFLCFLDSFGISWALLMGFAVFSVVEFVFALWLGGGRKNLLIRIAVCAVMELLPFLMHRVSLENCIAMVNLSQLAVNVVAGWMQYRRNPTGGNKLFAVGISLFAGCDYSILLRTLTVNGTALYIALYMLVWLCYIPCQILLVSSWVSQED